MGISKKLIKAKKIGYENVILLNQEILYIQNLKDLDPLKIRGRGFDLILIREKDKGLFETDPKYKQELMPCLMPGGLILYFPSDLVKVM